MATKPTAYPLWAEAAAGNYAVSGLPRRVQPPAAWRNNGWDENEEPPPNYENWQGYTTSQWVQWFDAACSRAATKVVIATGVSDHQGDYYCDGTADDVQIQAAVDAVAAAPYNGGTVLLSAGTFTIAAAINLRDKVQIVGSGPGTILQVDAATASDFAVLLISGITNASVVNLAIDGNIAGGHGHFHSGVQVTGASAGTLLERLYLRSFAMSGGSLFGYGVEIVGTAERTRVINSTTYDCRQQGIKAGSTVASQLTLIQGNVLRVGGSGGNGVSVIGGANVQVLNNTFTGLGAQISYSADPAPPTDVLMSGNVITGTAGAGIYMRGSRLQVVGNTMHTSGAQGIWAEQADLSIIADNLIDTADVDGIWLDDCDFIKVADNTIVDVSQAAHNTSDYISINDGQSADVHGNTCRATVGVTGRYGVWEDPANAPAATLCYGNYIGGAGATGTTLLIPGVGEAGAGTGVTLPHLLWDPVAAIWTGDSTIAVVPAGGLAQAPQRAAQLANY